MDATFIPADLVVVCLQGMTIGFSFEIFIKNLFTSKEQRKRVRVLKCLMGLSMAFKLILFMSMNCALFERACIIVGRFGDFLYHLSMFFGNAVLLDRVATVVPVHLARRFIILHIVILVLRFGIGITDTIIINVTAADNGSCIYEDNLIWGPVYTLYDTLTDLYVTVAITVILVIHVQKVKHADITTNVSLFLAIGVTNVLRTIILMVCNLVSAILIISKERQVVIMIAWPIINLLFILLVGHDTDIARAIRKMHQNYPHRSNSSASLSPTNGSNVQEYSSDKYSNNSTPVHNPSAHTDSLFQLQPTSTTTHTSTSHSPATLTDDERVRW